MADITLSYVLTTRNKLPYLKELLPDLIAAKKSDEEIIVADGASTDGTVAYLEQLLKGEKIDQLLYGPDAGEAHGFNKAIESSRGSLIKIITDDDAFNFLGIEECKQFMLAHPEIDFLSTDGIKRRKDARYPYGPMLYQSRFEERQRTHTPFAFCGLGIMFRKSSLPLLGYLHTGFVRVDAEYSLRVTAGKAKMAWYTGEGYAHILNQNSNSTTQVRRITEEMERLEAMYLGKPLRAAWEKKLRNFARPIKNWFKNKPSSRVKVEPEVALEDWKEMYRSSVSRLAENAHENKGQLLV